MRLHWIKQLVAHLLCNALTGKLIGLAFNDRVPSHGFRFYTDHPLIKSQTKARLFFGVYESAECRLVTKHLLPNLDVVELGSGLGVVSSLIARKLNSDRTLLSVEANPVTFPLTQRNIQENDCYARTRLIHGAVDYTSANEGSVRFGHSHTLHSGRISPQDSAATRVPSFTLKQLLEQQGMSGSFQLVMDIEGGELGLLLNEDLRLCRMILAELHDTTHAGTYYSVEDAVRLIQERHGFRLQERIGPCCCFQK